MIKRFVRNILFVFFLFSFLASGAQGILLHTLDGSEKGKSLIELLTSLEQSKSARFYFSKDWIASVTFQRSFEGQTLEAALDELLRGSDINFVDFYPNSIVFIKDPTQALLRKQAIEAAVVQQKKIDRLIIGKPENVVKGKMITLKGSVIDAKTNEVLPRANIQIANTPFGTTTDEAGNYSLSLSSGSHVINFSFVDYEGKLLDLVIYEDGEVNLELEKMPLVLDEVVIQSQFTKELTTTRIGQIQLTMRELKRAPAFLGEADIIKQVQTLPGVTTVGEAASGYNVRGGSVDQNLILYDGMPAFNSSHVFGFLSAFNSEAIRDVSFYRGGIPAEFGGRVSSVLDIQTKDGDFEKWNGKAGIGMITSNIMVNGPLVKERTSMAASFRSTYSNWLVHSIRTDYANLKNSAVSFYDGTIKLAHLFKNKSKLSFTGYASKDGFRLMGDSTYQWHSLQASLRYDRQISPTLNAEFIAGISSYGYNVINQNKLTASVLSYRITTTMIRAGFNYQYGNHKINFGGQLMHYGFDPGSFKPDSPISNAKEVSMDNQYAIENAFYGTEDWSFNEKIFIEGGLRLPIFLSFGPASVNLYKEGVPRELTNQTGVRNYRGAQIIKAYFGAEPRLSFRWMMSSKASVKLGYNRMNQFLHLVTNSTAVTPVDIWQPSGYYFKPQKADQISLGVFRDFRQKKYTSSAEVFYKSIKNILDFKDGAQLILNPHLETDLLQGKGYSYGLETFASRNTGRLTGSLNYTYSRTFRVINGPTPSESVNRGNRYPANFDQPHILNFSWKYNLSRRHYFTGNFTYHTGRPVTIPLSAFAYENSSYAYFSARNQYRIPDYHRLDMALVIEGNHKRKKSGEGTWVISIYNVYGRKNPYTVFFKSSGNGVPKPYQLSIIGTVFPSISYNFKF